MYYNSNKSNNDYYNAYKREISNLEAYRKEEKREKTIKLILSFFALALFILSAFYLYKYFNPVLDVKNSFLKNEKKTSQTKVLTNIVIREEELPLSIQLRESNSDTSRQKEQKIVIAMHEKDIALIVQSIMSQMNKKIEKPLEEQLQEINNKIVLRKNEVLEVKNASLMKSSTNFNNIMNEEINSNSGHASEIS